MCDGGMTKGASFHAGDGPKQGQLRRVASWEGRRGGCRSGSAGDVGTRCASLRLGGLWWPSCVSMRGRSAARAASLGRDGRGPTNVCGRRRSLLQAASKRNPSSGLEHTQKTVSTCHLQTLNSPGLSGAGVASNMRNEQQLHRELVLA